MSFATNSALAEELRRIVRESKPDRGKVDNILQRVVQAAREPADAYAFGRAGSASMLLLGNPFDQVSDRYRHFAWKAGSKEGARTEACGLHRRVG